ncbi:MAG: hypothetical protein ACXAC7_17800 [Candidatus Hodarchaeales archaeon]|jgi:hypothetical protein
MNKKTLYLNFQMFSTNFTPDAWKMVDSFISSLQAKMVDFDLTEMQQSTIFSCIEEYIQEFITDHKDKTMVNFNDTLKLLEEIGSPGEFLQAMDIPLNLQIKQKRPYQENKIGCYACDWPNEFDSQFCEKCGSKMPQDAKTPTLIHRLVFTFPNTFSILFSYLILNSCGLIDIFLIYLLSPSIGLENIIPILFPVSLIVMIAPAIVLGLILGYLVERIGPSQKQMNVPQQFVDYPNVFSIVFTYLVLFIINWAEGFVVWITIGEDISIFFRELFPAIIGISIIPAAVFGLLFAFLIEKLNEKQSLNPSRQINGQDNTQPHRSQIPNSN